MAFREKPVASQRCESKWTERTYRLHRQKLQLIRPSIDNRAPQHFGHLRQKVKRAQLEEDRQVEIERDNRTLVRRMTSIMSRPTFSTRSGVPNPGGGRSKTLNRDRRRRELEQITRENQALLRRVQARQPVLSHVNWEQEASKQEDLADRIGRFPRRAAADARRPVYYYDAAGEPTAFTETGGAGTAPPA